MAERFKEAVGMQDASNLMAVTNALQRAVREATDEGVHAREDSAVRLLVHQISFLTIGENFNWDYHAAYKACEAALKEG